MAGNTEEKEKCLEKLNQMQKFIPFLDFMIEKVSKKNNELSLECQLSKLQILRSMIAEKSEKYSWEAIIKVEDVIQRLTTVLDFKDRYDKSKEHLLSSDNESCKTSMETSISIVPSSTTSISVTTTSNSQATEVGVKPQELSIGTVDLMMKTLKTQVHTSTNKFTDRSKELVSNPLGSNSPFGESGRPMETGLHKDLDGYDLTDRPGLSKTRSSDTAVESVSEVSEKVSSHDDLLSKSRKKLLKSLQSTLLSCKTNHTSSQSLANDKTEKKSDLEITSASSRSQINASERKTKSGVSEPSDTNVVDKKKKVPATSDAVSSKALLNWKSKSVKLPEETSKPDVNIKQKLKEKLSTDICEVYRVPGKSVGGSLRSLKECKDFKKSLSTEEDLFKPDKIHEKGSKHGSSQLGSFSQSRDAPGDKSSQDSSTNFNEKRGKSSSDKAIKNTSGNDKRLDGENSKSWSQKSKSDRDGKKNDSKSLSKKIEEKNFELSKLNDEELLEFVKENMQSLPHLAKLKSSELRKAVESSLWGGFSALDAQPEASDDSSHDFDDFPNAGSKTKAKTDDNESKEPHPLASVKIAQVGSDGVAKNVKPIVEPSKGTKILEEIGDKTHDLDDTSLDSTADEEDYALRLIEETTSKAYPGQVKKRSLELPMPVTDDLFDEISSIGSFEPSSSPSENKDPRLAKLALNRSKSVSNKLESNSPDPNKAITDTWSARPVPNVPKDNNQFLRPQSGFSALNTPDNYKNQCGIQDRYEPVHGKHLASRSPQDMNLHHQIGNRYPRPNDYWVKNPVNAPFINPKHPPYMSPEPKSYAEYKRMKQEQEKMNRLDSLPKENPKSDSSDVFSRPAEKLFDRNTTKKNQDPRLFKYKDTTPKHNKFHSPVRSLENKKSQSYPFEWKPANEIQWESWDDDQETKKEERKAKVTDEKRNSLESDDLVSPLEELYRNEEKPKTGRGYGIQKFKIPKKVQNPITQVSPKRNKNHVRTGNGVKSDSKTEVSDVDSPKRTKETEKSEFSQASVADQSKDSGEGSRNRSESGVTTPIDATVIEDVPNTNVETVDSSVDATKTSSSITDDNSVICDVVESSEKTKPIQEPGSESISNDDGTTGPSVVESKTSSQTDGIEQTSNLKSDAQEQVVTPNESKTVTETKEKCGAQMIERDSGVESSSLNEQSSGKDSTESSDKGTVMQKEEITQEFVEALIRKSFQSGEGKVLLAQVKLFEELARKLNSKKLKTIQKIINSESDSSSSSSSSSSESFSEDEKRKKKSKKSEQKSKKRKKKGGKSKKHKLSFSSSSSSPCSWSESDETSEEESCGKKDFKSSTKQNSSSGSLSTTTDTKSKSSSDSSGLKSKGKRRCGRRARQKQKKKKLIEEILSESPPAEDPTTKNPDDVKKPQKKPGRTKGKTKTELDRLHDDIRGMFINAGVVTATGQRMCRILKHSGGNMNDVDIVKESAKMVEEEKLKKAQARASKSGRLAGNSDNRSEPLDKGTKPQREYDEEDTKLRLVPRVCLQRVNLDNFGYGIKISENCISFKRMKGLNKAIRCTGVRPALKHVERSISNPERGVFLQRNKRKFKRLAESKCKKVYLGKKLMDIVKNLPLKMASMKHLKICEKKGIQPQVFVREIEYGKKERINLSNSELLSYFLKKKKKAYSCKLCIYVASRNITSHYKEAHPEHEVLISRLCPMEAKSAKLDAEKNNYRLKGDAKASLGSTIKRKRKPCSTRSETYHCRMCSFSKPDDINSFVEHVSTHTGEYRYQCPAEGCNVRVHSRGAIKSHILSDHPKSRYEMYNKISYLYPLSVNGKTVFGYLCSLCHFVQILRCNLEKHISIQHDSWEDAKVLRINLSTVRRRRVAKKPRKSGSEEVSPCPNKVSNENEPCAETSREEEKNTSEDAVETKVEVMGKEIKQSSDDDGDKSDVESLKGKEIVLDENAEDVKVKINSVELKCNKKSAVEEESEVVKFEYNSSSMDVEDCVDLKNISSLKGSDIIPSVETAESNENPNKDNAESTVCKLKVGPLAAFLWPKSNVLYECYVKGCLFSTRAFDLFEQHIRISHWKTKWDGFCEMCGASKDIDPLGENSLKILTALRHLKLHETAKISGGKLSTKDLIMELKLMAPSEECTTDGEDGENSVQDEAKEARDVTDQMAEKAESSETPFPAKPLLRVRNLLGDRLSTPKADETDVVSINEQESSDTKLFTIENVRSLTEAPAGDSEIKIKQVCSLKDLVSKPAPQISSGKTIIVRSCPTRKIAIRPEPSPLSADVGTINVVQPPVVGHPVVLSPLSSTSPIRIISTPLLPKSTYTVKPVVVSTDAVPLNPPSMMPAIRPSLSPTITTTTILPISTSENCRVNPEVKLVPQKPVSHESNPGGGEDKPASKVMLDVEVIKSPTRSKSPAKYSITSQNTPKVNSSDQEDPEEKDTICPQKLASNMGKKSVKDAKIYKEMLTKTKLCHLFKCMGIECSFTCNDENVFTQHIGLHEAQARLKQNKGLKTLQLRLANKTTRAFYWQQCAYCCEVLSNTNKALSHHILEEHGHCMFQCAFCFYRAISHCYVEIHQNLAHSQILKTTPRVIYKCKSLKVPPSQAVALEKHGRKQSVRPYHCEQCGRKFYITQEFISHLQTEHQSVTAYTCHICKNLCFKINRLINHYKMHSYSTYQCAYCLHGTETEKEMVFHLCNFHFSQPAVMYVRALAEGQKHFSNQLDSLKVIVYEGDNSNLDCIVEVDADEDIPENVSESSSDLSSIVAELGIYTDTQSSPDATTPLMKELAAIGGKSAKHLTLKTLLPNAKFSSENENGAENCSVLISSGLSIPSDANNEREMNIPLGQLPLEAVNVQHKENAPSSPHPENTNSSDKNLKLNEIIVNLQQKDKNLPAPVKEEKVGESTAKHSTAVHKLPPVVLSRTSSVKNVYSAVKKKNNESQVKNCTEGNKVLAEKSSGGREGKVAECKLEGVPQKERIAEARNRKSSTEKQTEGNSEKTANDHLQIMNVVSLTNSEFDKGRTTEFGDESPFVSDVCSFSAPPEDKKENSSGIVINTKPGMNVSNLKPPIIRVEDFPLDDTIETASNGKSKVESKGSIEDKEKEESEKTQPSPPDQPRSPDVIILEDGKKKADIVTVTLDSDDEKEEKDSIPTDSKERTKKKDSKVVTECSAGKETIRKEMELLRNQIASETDSLLLDDPEPEKPTQNLTLNIEASKQNEGENAKTLLSPIEEAICSLNKKLRSESQEAYKEKEKQEEKNEEKNEKIAETPKAEINETKVRERPRTRFGKRKEDAENAEKHDSEDGGVKREVKYRKFKGELSGKDLFICGNENCNFAADDSLALKDHMYVCDLSRESVALVCPHCSRHIKHFRPYLEHLKYHGEKKLHCGLCPFSSAMDVSISAHLKQKHKCTYVKALPKETKEGHMVYYPKNYKVEKTDLAVNSYSPGDEDKLPLQSVYVVNVKCAKCPYFTKVRSNMVRHLRIHLKSVETEGVVVVPSTAPTNPVPCLETKERMFDKMTNLAASSQLAQAKEKTALENLTPEEEAKLPQFVAEQMRYKCCLPDCNYITVDDGMLKHHIKALHDEVNYYSCPHCRSTVHVDVRHVTLDKIGFHLKHHDSKLYKCAHCIFFHYQKNVVDKHILEKHPERRYFIHVVREPKVEVTSEEEASTSESGVRVWKCGVCDDFQTPSKSTLMDHLLKAHNSKSKYKCKLCSMKGNSYQAFSSHFASKHPREKVAYIKMYYSDKNTESQSGNSSGADSSNEHFDTTPLWQRGASRIRHIRGILIEEEEIKTKKSKKAAVCESETDSNTQLTLNENSFYCPLCTSEKKPFYTRNEDCFRTHLYQELNYQQFACILCGKMFVDRSNFERHHSRVHADKPQSLKQTKEDHEIKFWVDQVIEKQRKQMEERKRKLSDSEASGNQGAPKKKKEV